MVAFAVLGTEPKAFLHDERSTTRPQLSTLAHWHYQSLGKKVLLKDFPEQDILEKKENSLTGQRKRLLQQQGVQVKCGHY